MNATQKEQWRPVVGFEGIYEVSDQGRIKSLDRRGIDGRKIKGYIRPSSFNSYGYRRVSLSKNGKKRYYMVHRLVLEAFVSPCPEGMEGCHNDGNPANAKLNNLRWDTRSNNHMDKQIHGTDFHRNKTHCPKGHPLSGDNLVPWYSIRGYRKCKTCHYEQSARSRERRKVN